MLITGFCALAWVVLADSQELTKAPDVPRELQQQETYLLLSAKVKKMAEIQDLLIQQQQLILQHLDDLRRDVDQLRRPRTNDMTRAELAACVARLDQMETQFRRAQETNLQAACTLMQNMLAASDEREVLATNASAAAKCQPYIVQPGDTLLKIAARINESLARAKLPDITPDQIVRANPGLNADRIRIGQTLLIPIPAAP